MTTAIGVVLGGPQLPEYCSEYNKQIATLETCVLPDGTEKRGAELTFRESAEGGIRCMVCASFVTGVVAPVDGGSSAFSGV